MKRKSGLPKNGLSSCPWMVALWELRTLPLPPPRGLEDTGADCSDGPSP